MSHISPILVVLVVILSSLSTLANAIIIYGMFRFEKLKTVSNLILANLAITALLSAIIVPIVQFFLYNVEYPERSCLVMPATVTFHITVVLFGVLSCVDWYTATYCSKSFEKISSYFSYVIKGIWLTGLLFYMLFTGLCLHRLDYSFIITIIFAVPYIASLIFVVLLQFSRIRQKYRTLSVRLTIATIITCSYLTALGYATVIYYSNPYLHSYPYFVLHIAFICGLTLTIGSIATLYVLYRFNKDFRSCVFPTENSAIENSEQKISLIFEGKDVSPVGGIEKSLVFN